MIARLSEHSHRSTDLDVGRRGWLAAQPGFCGGYELFEPGTGHALSITMWEDDGALAAADRAAERFSDRDPPTVRLVRVTAVF